MNDSGVGGVEGGGPFLGVFATLSLPGCSARELPLSIRAAFRPVLASPPNMQTLLEAMLRTSGFSAARSLVRGLVQGLRVLSANDADGRADQVGVRCPSNCTVL